MNPWHDIEVGENQPQVVNAIIENPKDNSLKYEVDKESGLLKLDRYLFSSVHYPADYGFVPKTLWEDGDPLDIFVITHRPTVPLALCEVKVIGIIHMSDGGESDDKVLAVHAVDPRYSEWDDVSNVPKHIIKEIHNFLETYKMLENKEVKVFEIEGKEAAYEAIRRSMQLYNEKFQK